MPDERTLVQLEDITNTEPMDIEARKLGGAMVSKLERENSAMWAFPNKSSAYDFMFIARQRGYYASIQRALFPGSFDVLDALREDAERIRRALKKPRAKPPWAQ